MNIRRSIFVIITMCLMCTSMASGDVSIIPKPTSMTAGKGEFHLDRKTVISADTKHNGIASLMGERIGKILGSSRMTVTSKTPVTGFIQIKIDPSYAATGDEGYKLDINPKQVSIKAQKPIGLFYGMQTLIQICEQRSPAKGGKIALPCMRIEDRPAFEWRGLMLDCSRTFLNISYLKRYVDLLASYKMNVLHLHLTDDQGWRLEIKKYPKLTTIGAQFADRFKDNGGFYTQAQMRDFVAYARNRGVTIVPEIEMPGHSLGALTAYPELSCFGGPFEIHPFMEGPGIHYEVFCIGNENTAKFFEDVLSEVIDIFPSKYIHIGGDEVPRDQWHRCPKCQALMKAEGLKDENELQSFFTRRMEKFLLSKNRQLIGWDEIMEGGLSPKATVMSWRGVGPGVEALKQGHDVVFAPTTYCYFDYPHGVISIEKTYSYNPIPEGILSNDARIIGVQSCMWTHIARTEPDIDKQILPRLIALSEVAWSNPQNRNFDEFSKRLNPHLERISGMGFAYHKEPGPARYKKELRISFDFEGDNAWTSEGKDEITLKPARDSLQTVDGLADAGYFMRVSAESTASGMDDDRLLDFGRAPFMVEFWVRHQGQVDRQYGSTVFSYGEAGNSGWRIGINGKNEVLFSMYGIYDISGPKSIVPVDGKWHHVAVNVRKNQNLHFHVDGRLTDRLNINWVPSSPGSPVIIIGNDNSGTTPFVGDVDRIRVSSGEFSAGETDAFYTYRQTR
ncbi:MAG: family 20 glycosylhydrolase [Armatimonadota bacterium]